MPFGLIAENRLLSGNHKLCSLIVKKVIWKEISAGFACLWRFKGTWEKTFEKCLKPVSLHNKWVFKIFSIFELPLADLFFKKWKKKSINKLYHFYAKIYISRICKSVFVMLITDECKQFTFKIFVKLNFVKIFVKFTKMFSIISFCICVLIWNIHNEHHKQIKGFSV